MSLVVVGLVFVPVICKEADHVGFPLLLVPIPCRGAGTPFLALHAMHADLSLQTTYISITNNTNMLVIMPVCAALVEALNFYQFRSSPRLLNAISLLCQYNFKGK